MNSGLPSPPGGGSFFAFKVSAILDHMVGAYFCVLIVFVSRPRKDLIRLIIVVYINIKKYENNFHQDADKKRHVFKRICERKTAK